MCLFFEVCNDLDKCCHGGLEAIACCAFCMLTWDENMAGHSSRQKRFFLASCICCYALLILILSSIAFGTFMTQKDILNTTIDNWYLDPIEDIQISDLEVNQAYLNYTSCSNGFEPIYNITIPAISEGCECNGLFSDDDDYGDLSTGSCSSDQQDNGCNTISSQDPIFLPYWGQDGFTRKFEICAKRVKDNSFGKQMENKINVSPQTCQAANMKVCESSDQSLLFCIDKDKNCPVKKITISFSELSESETKNFGWELVKDLDGQLYIYISRQGNTMPLSEMKAGWGGGVCINNNLYNIDESREEDYPLNDPKGEFCSIDKRFELMFETNEKYLYTINDALQEIKLTRPRFPVSSSVKVGLYQRNYIVFKPQCRMKEFDTILNINPQMDTMLLAEAWVIILSFCFMILMLIIALNEIFRCCYDCGDKCQCKKFVKHIIQGGRWIFQLILAALIIYAFSYSIRVKDRFLEIVEANCTDHLTALTFTEIANTIQEVVIPLNTTILVLFIVVTFIDCYVVSKEYYKKHKKYKFKYKQTYQKKTTVQIYGKQDLARSKTYKDNEQYQQNVYNDQYNGDYPPNNDQNCNQNQDPYANQQPYYNEQPQQPYQPPQQQQFSDQPYQQQYQQPYQQQPGQPYQQPQPQPYQQQYQYQPAQPYSQPQQQAYQQPYPQNFQNQQDPSYQQQNQYQQ